jgi:hypothetical protein
VDLNGDGHVDLLSGSWPGELYFFRGGPGQTFADKETLKNKDGRPINPGGGVKRKDDGSIEIVGDAKWEESDDSPTGWVVIYQGERIVPNRDKEMYSTGNATAAYAVDWDGDNDLDLLVGTIDGQVYFIPNEGTPKAFAFGKEQLLEVTGKTLQVAGDAGPFPFDWDGDGDLDLLVGDGEGVVSLFRNNGSATTPQLAKAEQLVAPGEAEYGPKTPVKPTRGVRSKVCVTDWNGDGCPDLLVGDMAYLKPPAKELTDAEKQQHEAIREELMPIEKRRRVVIEKIVSKDKILNKVERKSLSNELKSLNEQRDKLQSQLPTEIEEHGWVWLFLRKPIRK